MELDEAIKSRKSVRNYSQKKTPDWRDIIECIDAMRYAPSAGNIPTMKVVLVKDPEKIAKLAKACQQPFVAQAKYVVVVCSNPKILVSSYDEKGQVFNRQQNGAAIENFLLKIEEKGLATCWVGYFVESQIKEVLLIPDKSDVQIEAVFPIGIESEIKGKKSHARKKIELDGILYFEKYGNKRMSQPRKIET